MVEVAQSRKDNLHNSMTKYAIYNQMKLMEKVFELAKESGKKKHD